MATAEELRQEYEEKFGSTIESALQNPIEYYKVPRPDIYAWLQAHPEVYEVIGRTRPASVVYTGGGQEVWYGGEMVSEVKPEQVTYIVGGRKMTEQQYQDYMTKGGTLPIQSLSYAREAEPQRTLADLYTYSGIVSDRKMSLFDIGQPIRMQPPAPELRGETILSYSLFHPTETAVALGTWGFFPQERERLRREERERITQWSFQMRKEGIAGIGKQAIFTGVEYALWTGVPIIPAKIITKTPTLAKLGFTALTTTFAIEMFRGGEAYLAGAGLPAARKTVISGLGFGLSAAAMKAAFEPPKVEIIEREVISRYRTQQDVEPTDLRQTFRRVITGEAKTIEPSSAIERGLSSRSEFLDKKGWKYIISEKPTGLATIDDEFFDVVRVKMAGKYEMVDVDIYAGGQAEFPIAPPKPPKTKGEGFTVFKPSKTPKTDLSKHFPKGLDIKLEKGLDIRPIKIKTTTVTPVAEVSATPFVSLGAIQITGMKTDTRQKTSFLGRQIQLQHPKQFEYTISPIKTRTKVKKESLSLISPMKMPMVSPITVSSPITRTRQRQAARQITRQFVSPALVPPSLPRTSKAKTPTFRGLGFPSFKFDTSMFKHKRRKIKRLRRKTIPEPSLGGIVLGKVGKLKPTFTGIEPIRPIGIKMGKKRKKKKKRKSNVWMR